MASKFEDLMYGLVNVGIGATATAAEKGREVLESLNAKGEQVRQDSSGSDFSRSVSDAFARANTAVSDLYTRLSRQGDMTAERILDELIVARLRTLEPSQRLRFVSHVADLISMVDSEVVNVPVEAVDDVDGVAADEPVSPSDEPRE